MNDVFRKLNLKNHAQIMILDAPSSFENEIRSLEGVEVIRSTEGQASPSFLLAFVTERTAIERVALFLDLESTKDPIVWFAYPKGTSKNYKCDFNRDSGWESLKEKGFDTVRQVSIDEDWSALRFRDARYIKY